MTVSDKSFLESLYLLHARLHDLEMRQRIAPIETDKIHSIVALVDKVLLSRTGLTAAEVLYHKLDKYIPVDEVERW